MNHLQPRTDHRFDPLEPHPELDDVDISDLDDVDWNSNTDPFGIFAARGMAPPPVQKPSAVRQEAKEKSSQIHKDYGLLRSIVERHESKIQKRWEKKTKTQKLAILVGAWPRSMPSTHRPDFAAFRQFSGRLDQPAIQKNLRGAFMWPYINQEDLSKSKTLPMLLNARARNHPSVFAAADGEAMHLGRTTMVLVPPFLNSYTMVMNGMTGEEDYGKLVGWDEHEDAFDWLHQRKQFLPGEGLLILEAQAGLLAFLVSCCRQILHDIPFEQLCSDMYPVEPEPALKPTNDGAVAGVLPSLTALAEEAPYRPPQKLDLEKITSLLAARAASAQDHIWALREDPGYYVDEVLQIREHRQEMIKDVQGNVHPTLRAGREDLFWARVIGNVVLESIFQLELFTELHGQAVHLQALQANYEARGEISPSSDLPEEYLAALLKFRHWLNQVAKGPMNQLKVTVASSPPMRHMFVRQVPESLTSSKIGVMLKASAMKMDKVTEQVVWLLRTLWEDGKDLFLAGMPLVVDELDRLLRTDPRASEMVSHYVARLIGELSIVAECLRQINNYQPWANGFENTMVDRESDVKKEFAKRTQTEARIMEVLRDETLVKGGIPKLGEPRNFDYPVGKRRNKAVVDALRAAEANLDRVWRMTDSLLDTKVGAGLDGTATRRFLSQSRSLQRTPEWVEPIKGKERSGLPPVPDIESITTPLSSIFLGSEAPSARKEILASSTKSKVKSRGTPGSRLEPAATLSPAADADTPDYQPTFLVDARALKVFRVIFFDPSANTTPGEVAWTDFLHALDCVGLRAQKLYGSVWHFQPTKLDEERSIQFHEPHPQAKIPFLIARRHGRRLNRAYGWNGSMFVLRNKN